MDVAAEISPLDYGRAFLGILMIGISIGILTYCRKHMPERYQQFRVPGFVACAFGGLLISLTLTGGVRHASRRLAFRETVQQLTAGKHVLKINGEQIINSQPYAAELVLLQPRFSRKSHPVGKYEVTIEGDQETMRIVLQQDSRRNDEFWTWWSFGEDDDRRVGTIKSTVLRDLLKAPLDPDAG